MMTAREQGHRLVTRCPGVSGLCRHGVDAAEAYRASHRGFGEWPDIICHEDGVLPPREGGSARDRMRTVRGSGEIAGRKEGS